MISFLYISFYCINSVFSYSVLNDACYDNVEIYHNSSAPTTDVYNVLNNSTLCAEKQDAISELSNSEPSLCPPGLLSIQLSPISVFGSRNILPHVQLNISVMVFSHVSSVFVRLQCLHAPDGEDVYCHDSTRMIVGGIWQWPCRAVQLMDNAVMQYPFRFGYSCFRMYGLSQYVVNVTVQPQNCLASLLITSPQDSQLFPSIAEFYAHKPLPDPPWSPSLIVDLSDKEGVWLIVAAPPTLIVRTISLSLFERTSEGIQPIRTFEILHPHTGQRWDNAPSGDYVLYAHVPRHDCLLLCDSAANSSCRICPHTHLNFTLTDERTSFAWKGLRTIRDSGGQVLLFMAGLLFLVMLAGVLYLVILRKSNSHLHRDIQLIERPKVLVVYSHDSVEHFEAVHEFANLLSRKANATVMIDHNELNRTGVRPSHWLVNSMRNAEHVLLVVSPCTEHILNGRQLAQSKPYPDMFAPAADIIVKECVSMAGDRSRFAIVRLPYSPEVPYQLSVLGLKTFAVPSELAQLTAFLHGLAPSGSVRHQSMDAATLAPLAAACERMRGMTVDTPDWMERQWTDVQQPLPAEQSDHNLPPAEVRGRTETERLEMAEEYGLLPADEREDHTDEEEGGDFQLLPPDSSDSDGD